MSRAARLLRQSARSGPSAACLSVAERPFPPFCSPGRILPLARSSHTRTKGESSASTSTSPGAARRVRGLRVAGIFYTCTNLGNVDLACDHTSSRHIQDTEISDVATLDTLATPSRFVFSGDWGRQLATGVRFLSLTNPRWLWFVCSNAVWAAGDLPHLHQICPI
jgi:hypothetical protein